jgi:SAM-dependent methyltransferase
VSTNTDTYQTDYHARRFAELIAMPDYWDTWAELTPAYYFPDTWDRRIFDYGCGQGQSIGRMPNAAGWDIGAPAREFARSKGVRIFDAFEEVPAGEWDIVFCRHVLEHVEQPLEVLRRLLPLLAPGGHLFLVLPREKHLETRFQPDLDQHLYCWNFRTIFNLLWRAGWEPYHAETRFPFGALKLLPIRRRFGFRAYFALSLVGEIARRNGEIWVHARPAQAIPQ